MNSTLVLTSKQKKSFDFDLVQADLFSKISGLSQGLKFFWGGLVVLGGDNVSPLVEIGLADLPPPCDGPAISWWQKIPNTKCNVFMY